LAVNLPFNYLAFLIRKYLILMKLFYTILITLEIHPPAKAGGFLSRGIVNGIDKFRSLKENEWIIM